MRKKVGFSTVPKSSPLNQFPSWKCGIGMQNSWYSSPTTSRIKSARSCGRAAPHLADFAPGGQTVPHWGRLIATKLKWKKNNTLSISSHLHPYLTMWYYVYYICSIRPLYIYIIIYILYQIWYTSKDRTEHMHVAFSRSAHLLVIPFPSNPPFHAHISRWINFCRQLLRACLVTRFCHTRHKYIPQSKPTTRPPSADWIGDLRGEATRRTGTSGYHIWLIY